MAIRVQLESVTLLQAMIKNWIMSLKIMSWSEMKNFKLLLTNYEILLEPRCAPAHLVKRVSCDEVVVQQRLPSALCDESVVRRKR